MTSNVEETLTHRLSSETTTHRQILVVGPKGTTTFRVPPSGAVTIGRTNQCTIRLDDGHASRHHATLYFGERVTAVDHGSTNGTHVGEQRIAPDVPVVVDPGVVLRIGNTTIVIQSCAPSPRPRQLRSHGYFEARLEEECLRAEATGGTFAVVRLRCDGLGASLAEAGFARWLRPMDVVAIYAPNEYELLLPDTSPAAADGMCRPIEAALKERGAGIEMNIACYPLDGRSPELLVARAGSVPQANVRTSISMSAATRAGAMARLAPVVERVAAGNISALILGETGVGKEVLAHSIHRMSNRANGPLLCLNCAAFTETLLESELFGHERGAFTGAVSAKQGLLESASGGTVFLDEIGEMPPGVQARLLRVIEQRQVLRIGAVRPRAIDVRFIAATNRDLEAEIARGTFRQDLYFRLNGVTLYVPPLRERVDEIESLAAEFIEHFSRESARPRPRLSVDALALLRSYGWPGNIRELRNVIERAVLLCEGPEITIDHLPAEKMGRALPLPYVETSQWASRPLARPDSRPSERLTIPDHESGMTRTAPHAFMPPGLSPASPQSMQPQSMQPQSGINPTGGDDAERQRIIRALEECAGNQTQAARLLGISRGTLISRLELYALPRPRRSPST